MRALEYVEIDVPEFAGTSSPLPIETYRFAKPANYLPRDIEAIPSVKSVSFSPSRVSLGENLGERASLTIVFKDHPHIFNGEPFDQGTFWGKWRGRYGTRLIGNSLRWIQGFESQTLAQMTTRHFIIESVEGPSLSGEYKIVAKDILKLADDDRAQAPKISSGFLASDLSDTATSATLSPTGIGDAEYPSSGYVAIGGEEICAFTRSGDTLTFETDESPAQSGRGQLGTTASEHGAGDRVQLVLRYVGEDPADIIRDLFVNYANFPESYIPLSAWQDETSNFLQRLYTATIPEPTSVHKLVSELIQQAALAVWDDLTTPQVRLQVLREIATDAARFTPDNTLADPQLSIREQPKRRISQVWTYFGQRNPLEPLDEVNNYRSVVATVDLDAEDDYGRPAIKQIHSRWIPFGGRSVAERVNDILMARFRDPPRRFSFAVMRGDGITPQLGMGYRIEAYPIQTQAGLPTDAPIQVTRLNPGPARTRVEADEMLFNATPVDLTNRVIVIDADAFNVNMRALHDQIFPDPTGSESPQVTVHCIVQEGVIVGSEDTTLTAFDVGSWPAGISLKLTVRGRIQGKGADGGNANELIGGQDGGDALLTTVPIELALNEGSGEVWSGSGGGGNSSPASIPGDAGGGGAGQLPGNGGQNGFDGPGEDGTTEKGGEPSGPDGGKGGDPGQDGEDGLATVGGTAGHAINGVSNVTKTGVGDIRGTEVN